MKQEYPICEDQSDSSLGWVYRRIRNVHDCGSGRVSVELNDMVSFESPCFNTAKVGEIWKVNHEPGGFCFGQVKEAHKVADS